MVNICSHKLLICTWIPMNRYFNNSAKYTHAVSCVDMETIGNRAMMYLYYCCTMYTYFSAHRSWMNAAKMMNKQKYEYELVQHMSMPGSRWLLVYREYHIRCYIYRVEYSKEHCILCSKYTDKKVPDVSHDLL